MTAYKKGNRYGFTVYVTPEVYETIEKERGILKRATFIGVVLEEIFNPPEESANVGSTCN
jgi:hypothetical protein